MPSESDSASVLIRPLIGPVLGIELNLTRVLLAAVGSYERESHMVSCMNTDRTEIQVWRRCDLTPWEASATVAKIYNSWAPHGFLPIRKECVGNPDKPPSKELPQFEPESGDWVAARDAAGIEGRSPCVLVGTRKKAVLTWTYTSGMAVVDRDGRIFRRPDHEGSS